MASLLSEFSEIINASGGTSTNSFSVNEGYGQTQFNEILSNEGYAEINIENIDLPSEQAPYEPYYTKMNYFNSVGDIIPNQSIGELPESIEVSASEITVPEVASASGYTAVAAATATKTTTGITVLETTKGLLADGSLYATALGTWAACGLFVAAGVAEAKSNARLVRLAFKIEKALGKLPLYPDSWQPELASEEELEEVLKIWQDTSVTQWLLSDGKSYAPEQVIDAVIEASYGFDKDGNYNPDEDFANLDNPNFDVPTTPDFSFLEDFKGLAGQGVTKTSNNNWNYPHGDPIFMIEFDQPWNNATQYAVFSTVDHWREWLAAGGKKMGDTIEYHGNKECWVLTIQNDMSMGIRRKYLVETAGASTIQTDGFLRLYQLNPSSGTAQLFETALNNFTIHHLGFISASSVPIFVNRGSSDTTGDTYANQYLRGELPEDLEGYALNAGGDSDDYLFRPFIGKDGITPKTKEDAKNKIKNNSDKTSTANLGDYSEPSNIGDVYTFPSVDWYSLASPVLNDDGSDLIQQSPDDTMRGDPVDPLLNPDSTYNPWKNPWPSPLPTTDPATKIPTDLSPTPQKPTDSDPAQPTDTGSSPVFVPPAIADTGMWAVYHPTESNLRSFSSWLWGSGFNLDTFKKLFQDPMEAVIGLHKIYLTPTDAGSSTIRVGYIDSNVSSPYITQYVQSIDCGWASVSELFRDYADYSPYTYARLYLPFVGFVSLNVDEIMNASINVIYRCNVVTGACVAEVTVKRNSMSAILYSFPGQISEPMPITSGSLRETYAAVAGVVASVAATIATGGAAAPFVAAGTVASGMANAKAHTEMLGNLSGNVGALGVKKPYIIVGRRPQKTPDTINENGGYPAFASVNLSSLHGFTKVHSVHIQGIDCTSEEAKEIESILKEGVIL